MVVTPHRRYGEYVFLDGDPDSEFLDWLNARCWAELGRDDQGRIRSVLLLDRCDGWHRPLSRPTAHRGWPSGRPVFDLSAPFSATVPGFPWGITG